MVTLAFIPGGTHIMWIWIVVTMLFGFGRLPPLERVLGRVLGAALDDEAHDAGRSIGGIHGKPAAVGLTTDNQVAEVYDSEALQGDQGTRQWRELIRRVLGDLRRVFGV